MREYSYPCPPHAPQAQGLGSRRAWVEREEEGYPPMDVACKLLNSQDLGALEFASDNILAIQAYLPPEPDRGCGVFTAQTVRDGRGVDGERYTKSWELSKWPIWSWHKRAPATVDAMMVLGERQDVMEQVH